MPSKEMDNPIELRAVMHINLDGLHIDTAKICYTVTCEHEINEGRMLLLQHTPELRNCAKDFAEEAVRQTDIHESIAEGDSLLEYDAQGNGHVPPL